MLDLFNVATNRDGGGGGDGTFFHTPFLREFSKPLCTNAASVELKPFVLAVSIWDIVSVVNASLCIMTVVSDFHQFVLLSVTNLILRSP